MGLKILKDPVMVYYHGSSKLGKKKKKNQSEKLLGFYQFFHENHKFFKMFFWEIAVTLSF